MLKSRPGLLWLPVLSVLASSRSLAVLGLGGLGHAWASDTGVNGRTQYTANVATFVLVACRLRRARVRADVLPRRARARRERAAAGPRHDGAGRALAVATRGCTASCRGRSSQATVSMIIQAIEERFGFLGQIIGSLLGAAWNVVTFLDRPDHRVRGRRPGERAQALGHAAQADLGREPLRPSSGLGLSVLARRHARRVRASALGVASGTALVAVPLIAIGGRLPRRRRHR